MPTDRAVAVRPGYQLSDAAPLGDERPGMVRAGLALTYLSAATIPWTGFGIGSIQFGEIFLVLAAAALVAGDFRRATVEIPQWVWALVLAVLVVGAVNQFAPPSLPYMAQRVQLLPNNVIGHSTLVLVSNLSVMAHLLVRIVLLPVAFVLARTFDRRALFHAAMAFVAGAAISASVAFLDSRGITSIGFDLTGVPVADRRASGLTTHPNVVAMACVLALPLVIWQVQAARSRARLLAVLGLIALLLGLYASRSRSGAVAAAAAGLVALGWLPQYRRHLATVGFLLTLVLGAVFAAKPTLGADLLGALRLNGDDTGGSDRARAIVNTQAMSDFLHSPVHGIGLEVADVAHVVYLQALAVGGVILLTGLVIYLLGAMVRAARLAKVDPLALPLLISVLGLAIFNAVQNALTPTLAYIAPSLVAALPLATSWGAGDDPDARSGTGAT